MQRAGDEVVLTEVYRQQTLQKHLVATWRNHQFLWTNSTMLKRRGDLQGVTVRVGVGAKASAHIMYFKMTIRYTIHLQINYNVKIPVISSILYLIMRIFVLQQNENMVLLVFLSHKMRNFIVCTVHLI